MSGQVRAMLLGDQPGESVIGLGWLVPKQISYQNYVHFPTGEVDSYGMPRPAIRYRLSGRDRELIRQAAADQLRAARAVADSPPESLAAKGSSGWEFPSLSGHCAARPCQ